MPNTDWKKPVFVERNYDKEGLKSYPEWGVNISKKNYSILQDKYFEKSIRCFLRDEDTKAAAEQ